MKNSALSIAAAVILLAAVAQNAMLWTLTRRVTTLEARVTAMQSRAARFSMIPGTMRPLPPGGVMPSPEMFPSGAPAAADTPYAVMDEAAANVMARLIQLEDSPGLGLSPEKKAALRKAMAKSWPPAPDLAKARAQAAALEREFTAALDEGQKQVLSRLDFVVSGTSQALRNRAAARGTNVYTMLTGFLEGQTPAP